MNGVLSALRAGKNPKHILDFIGQLHPELKQKIAAAIGAGKSVESVIKYLAQYNPVESTEKRQTYSNPYSQALKGSTEAANNIAKAGVTAASLAASYGAYKHLTKAAGAVYPSEIVKASPEIAHKPLGLPFQGQRGLPAPMAGAPSPQPTAPQAPQAPIAPAGVASAAATEMQPPEPVTPQEKTIVAKEQENQQLWQLAQKGKRTGTPSDDFLKTAHKLIKSGDITDYDKFKQFRNWWKATEGQSRGPALAEFETFRNQTKGWTPVEEPLKAGEKVQTPKGKADIKELSKKVATVSFEDGSKGQYDTSKLKRLEESAPKAKIYANALYKMPDESEESWQDRHLIHSAANKAAKNIMEGKTFLDLPTPKGISKHMSTAVDVLQFMAGVPNIYNDLLDDDEKQELYEGSGFGQMMQPSKLGERNIYGANITPNMVWNMLLSVEPKLATMKRPMAQKKSGALKSGKMGSAEFRRTLTHAVYGILSGKNISTELSDKINKISSASGLLDNLVKSFKEKNAKLTESEMEKLASDEYFSSLFTDEIEEMIKRFR